MARHLHDLGTLTIPNGGTFSPAYTGSSPGQVQAVLGAMSSLVIFAPATLPEVINVEVSPIRSPNEVWSVLQWQPGTTIVIGAGLAVNIPLVAGFRSLRMFATSAVGGARVFTLCAQVDADYES